MQLSHSPLSLFGFCLPVSLATASRGMYPPTSSQIPEAQAPRRPAGLSYWPPPPGVVLLTEMPPSDFPLSFGPVLTRQQRGFGDVAVRAKLGRSAARGGGGTTVAVGALDVAEELLGLAQVLPQPSQVAAVASEAPAQLADHSAASRTRARHGLACPRLPVGLHRSARCLRGRLRCWPGPLLPPPSAQRRRNPPPDATAGAPHGLQPPSLRQLSSQSARLPGQNLTPLPSRARKELTEAPSLRGLLGLVVWAGWNATTPTGKKRASGWTRLIPVLTLSSFKRCSCTVHEFLRKGRTRRL